jgi:hypothetical protein
MVACGKGANAGRSDGKEELRGSCLLTSVSLHDEVHPAEGLLADVVGRHFRKEPAAGSFSLTSSLP